jgi:hypothetical protein
MEGVLRQATGMLHSHPSSIDILHLLLHQWLVFWVLAIRTCFSPGLGTSLVGVVQHHHDGLVLPLSCALLTANV